MVYHSLLGEPWDCAVCPRPPRLALFTMGNQTAILWLCTQRPRPLSCPMRIYIIAKNAGFVSSHGENQVASVSFTLFIQIGECRITLFLVDPIISIKLKSTIKKREHELSELERAVWGVQNTESPSPAMLAGGILGFVVQKRAFPNSGSPSLHH